MKKAIYFDTSAINWLYLDNEHEKVITAIHDYSFVQISVLTIAELGAHPMGGDRMGLLNLAKDISHNYRPVAVPSELLKGSLEAFRANAVTMDASIGADWDGVWYALNHPELIHEEDYAEILEWKKHQEKWYHIRTCTMKVVLTSKEPFQGCRNQKENSY